MIIRKAEIYDVNNICLIHKFAFDKNHFSAKLSGSLLYKFYSALLRSNSYNFIALDDTQNILGFIVAGKNTNTAIDSFVKENKVSVLLVLIKNPKFWVEKILIYIKKIIPHYEFKSSASLRLLSIAVKRGSGNRGIGTALINHFEDALAKDNHLSYGLSVKKHNKNAIQFYFKNKFEIEYEEKDALYFIKKISAQNKDAE